MSPHKYVAIRFYPRGSFEPFTEPSPFLINDRPIEFAEAHADLGLWWIEALIFMLTRGKLWQLLVP